MTARERMIAGLEYDPADPVLVAGRDRAAALLLRLHGLAARDARAAVLRELLGGLGGGVEIRAGFACDYGTQIHIGAGSFVNFHVVMLDCAPIRIGRRVQIAPAVQLYTATHPLDPVARGSGRESAAAIDIGDDVWLGGGAIVLPGITIGAGAVVAAGAVVTRDVPPRTLVAGNPARVLRAV